jgi:hypothetical protein
VSARVSREEVVRIIVAGMERGNDVRLWPADEAAVHRAYMDAPRPETGLYGSFEDRHAHVVAYRAGKVADVLAWVDSLGYVPSGAGEYCCEAGCDADMTTMMCPNDRKSCVDHCGEGH